MTKILIRGEVVYKCTVCARKIRVPRNRKGLDVINHCTITKGCRGILHRVTQLSDINNTPTLTPSVEGVWDWVQNNTLHTHSQEIASVVWRINHNLGSDPNITVYVNTQGPIGISLTQMSQPSVSVIDSNNIQILFDKAQSGVAQLVTLSSQNTINPTTTIPPVAEEHVQISTNQGLISIGTLLSDPSINITIRFVVAGQPNIDITYNNILDVPLVSSPWIGANRVFVEGKKYTTRSIDLTTHAGALPYFLSGQIPQQGAIMYITAINNTPPIPKDILILEANQPFGPTDRVYDYYIDFSGETLASSNITYSYGKFFANNIANKSTYPYIIVV